MYRDEQATAQQAKRIIADPFAQENSWLPACALIGNSVSAPPARALPLLKIAAAVFLSLFVAHTGTLAVNLGFDWGYKLVEQIFGQPDASNQGIGALLALPIVITPILCGLTFGCVKQLCFGSRSWSVAGSAAALCFLLFGVAGPSFGVLDLLGPQRNIVLTVNCFILLFYYVGYVLSREVSKQLQLRLRLDKIAVISLCSLALISGAAHLTQTNLNWMTELTIYICLLATGAAQAARYTDARNRVGAVMIAILASSPLMLANLFNVLGTCISFFMDHYEMGLHLGWRAILSACLISIATIIASVVGGVVGFWLKPENTDVPPRLPRIFRGLHQLND